MNIRWLQIIEVVIFFTPAAYFLITYNAWVTFILVLLIGSHVIPLPKWFKKHEMVFQVLLYVSAYSLLPWGEISSSINYVNESKVICKEIEKGWDLDKVEKIIKRNNYVLKRISPFVAIIHKPEMKSFKVCTILIKDNKVSATSYQRSLD